MNGTPIWQQSLSAFTFDDLVQFIEEKIPEHEHLEYKRASYNTQNRKPDFDERFLPTIVAFANGGGGLVIYGIEEDGHSKPKIIEGERPTASGLRRLEKSINDACANWIEPTVHLDTRILIIPEGHDHAGSQVALIRVRPGLVPPYNLRGGGIFLRGGKEGDRHAGIREIQHLFDTRALTGPSHRSPWKLAVGDAFVYDQQHILTHGPFLGVALTPAFPIDPIEMDIEHDYALRMLCEMIFDKSGGRLMREPDGVGYGWFREPECNDHPPYTRAFNEGSIGIRRSLYQGDRHRPSGNELFPVNLEAVWQALWGTLSAVSNWPWEFCNYQGPLTVHVGLGNLANTYVIVGSTNEFPLPDIEPNRLPGWSKQLEWDQGQRPEMILEAALPELARQLQFGEFATIRNHLRALTAHAPWKWGPAPAG